MGSKSKSKTGKAAKTGKAKLNGKKAGSRKVKKWPVHVEESGIHGKGLFASRDIEADTKIIPIKGKPAADDGIYVLWWIEEDGSEKGMEVTNEARYVNHDANPNAAYFDTHVWSLRKISKGEEITHDYGAEWADL